MKTPRSRVLVVMGLALLPAVSAAAPRRLIRGRATRAAASCYSRGREVRVAPRAPVAAR